MRRNCCHVSFASILKILNFLQAFFGISIIIYSIWMLDQWNRRLPVDPPPMAPSPDSSSLSNSGVEITKVSDHVNPLNVAADIVFGSVNDLGFDLHSFKLPAPWFIYSFMGVGILVCVVTIIGFIAAEAINGCCLCFYSVLKIILILLEVGLVAFIAIDRRWEKDLPYDPTGELDSLRSFIEDNIDICKWVGIAVLAIQAMSLLLAIVLRAMVSTRRNDLDEEEDYENPRGTTRGLLLNSQANQTPGSSKIDTWIERMREKYGSNFVDKHAAPK